MREIWTCRMCGRSFRTEKEPKFCYFDRMDFLERIEPKEADKMGFFKGQEDSGEEIQFEFPADIRFDPFTGEKKADWIGWSLDVFQDRVMEGVKC